MRENVLFGPTRNIEERTCGKEVEAGLGEAGPALAIKALVELFLELVEVANIARRIFALGIGELVCAPVAGLLLLGKIDAKQFLDQILETVAVGVGPDQTRRGAGAVERRRHDPEIGL